jgi:ABC-type sugar transport system ATPase subunit
VDALNGAAKLRLSHVGKRFALKGGAEAVALQDFSLDVRQGEFLVVVGPSAAARRRC